MLYDSEWWNAAEAQARSWFPEFHRNLYTQHPELSLHEIQHCTLVLLKHSTQDMAKAFGIEIESLHVASYRLRKHLNVPHSDTLFAHLMAIANHDDGGGELILNCRRISGSLIPFSILQKDVRSTSLRQWKEFHFRSVNASCLTR